ncbi:phenazine biosynthesis protein PhzF [Gammaproteobacteria bacterium 53_120_T64]|nr:phenazine biosynthesis protein PhzF [Gammaproteobacteria bacterium 53_120_T64]
MKLKLHHINAFTDTLFTGNYAGVIFLDEWLSTALMQAIATENNLSETAFVKQTADNTYQIRWFSPLSEIDFCGHATLASAYVLFKQDQALDDLEFYAKAVGTLKVRRETDGLIAMTFPRQMPEPVSDIPPPLLAGLSIAPSEVLINRQAYFAIYTSETDIHSLKPNLAELKKLAPYDVVISAAAHDYDFISRYFWPASGGDEDPVTGSIHSGLAPFWAQRLNKTPLTAYQASQRGGLLHCRMQTDSVIISGRAVQYLEGDIEI